MIPTLVLLALVALVIALAGFPDLALGFLAIAALVLVAFNYRGRRRGQG